MNSYHSKFKGEFDNYPVKTGWVVLFSQTGSELVRLARRIGFVPDVILTNTKLPLSEDILMMARRSMLVTLKHDQIMDLMRDEEVVNQVKKAGGIVTLHGYLRILPADICDLYEIYNGHPGLITKYPELKGKDPQKKVIDNVTKYLNSTIGVVEVGSVVHRVTAGVDEGPVIVVSTTALDYLLLCESLITREEVVYSALADTSLLCWEQFFKGR